MKLKTAEEVIAQMKIELKRREAIRNIEDFIETSPNPEVGLAQLTPRVPEEWWVSVDCNDCVCDKIQETIESNILVIDRLLGITDFTKDLPTVQAYATAAGIREEGYFKQPRCIQKLIEEMESLSQTLPHAWGYFGAFIRNIGSIIGDQEFSSLRKRFVDVEIFRSVQFNEYLKALFWWCCGEAAYQDLLKHLLGVQAELHVPGG